jgi:tetratricopeptide (TPR) repeat protein
VKNNQKPLIEHWMDFKLSSEKTHLDMNVPQTGLNINNLIQYVKNAFGLKSNIVTGGLLTVNNTLEFQLRFNNKYFKIKTDSNSSESMDMLLTESAVWLMKETSPIGYSAYLIKTKKYVQAEQTLKSLLLKITTPDELAETHYVLGKLYSKTRRFAQASAQFEKATKIKSDFVAAYNSWGLVLTNSGDVERALSVYETVNKIDPSETTVVQNWAALLNNNDFYDLALAKYNSLLLIDSLNVTSLYGKASASRNKGDFQTAIVTITKAIDISPFYTGAWKFLAETYSLMGNSYKEFRVIDEMLSLSPNDSKLLQAWGAYYYAHYRSENAIDKFKILLERDSTDWDALLYMAKSLNDMGQKKEVNKLRAKMKRILATMPDEGERLSGFAYLCHDMEDYEEAITYYKKAILNNDYPSREVDIFNLAVCYRDRKMPSECSRILLQSADLIFTPDDVLSWASELVDADSISAENLFKNQIIRRPHNAGLWNNYGVMLHNRKRYREALKKFQRATTLNPNQAIYQNNCALALSQLNQPDSAAHYAYLACRTNIYYDRAIETYMGTFLEKKIPTDTLLVFNFLDSLSDRNSNNPWFLNKIGRNYYSLKNFDRARTCFEQAFKLDPEYIAMLGRVADALTEAKKLSEGKDVYLQQIASDPLNIDAFNNLAYTYELLKDTVNGSKYINVALALPFDEYKKATAYSPKAELCGLLGQDNNFYANISKALENGWELSAETMKESPYSKYANQPRFKKLLKLYDVKIDL